MTPPPRHGRPCIDCPFHPLARRLRKGAERCPLWASRAAHRGGIYVPDEANPLANGATGLLAPEVHSGGESLPADRCLKIHRLMVRSRALEERMIKMSKSGQVHFWIGGPGEEAFNVPFGL